MYRFQIQGLSKSGEDVQESQVLLFQMTGAVALLITGVILVTCCIHKKKKDNYSNRISSLYRDTNADGANGSGCAEHAQEALYNEPEEQEQQKTNLQILPGQYNRIVFNKKPIVVEHGYDTTCAGSTREDLAYGTREFSERLQRESCYSHTNTLSAQTQTSGAMYSSIESSKDFTNSSNKLENKEKLFKNCPPNFTTAGTDIYNHVGNERLVSALNNSKYSHINIHQPTGSDVRSEVPQHQLPPSDVYAIVQKTDNGQKMPKKKRRRKCKHQSSATQGNQFNSAPNTHFSPPHFADPSPSGFSNDGGQAEPLYENLGSSYAPNSGTSADQEFEPSPHQHLYVNQDSPLYTNFNAETGELFEEHLYGNL